MLIDLEQFIRRQGLIAPGDRVICAVSGGADSMALLWGLYLLKSKLKITLEAAHFNHGLRGEESDGDEAFVADFCADYQIPLHRSGTVVQPGKKGLEAAARDARYAFFQTLSDKIATAHTADDNAETVLMHLIRGTGLKGLGGIHPRRGRVIRPMLGVTRAQVLAFLEEYHIPYREDSSNATDAFLRNRLRHHIMPLLKEENPRLAENLSAMALRLRQDEEALQELSQVDQPRSVSRLRQMPPALRARALERFLKESGVREPEAEHMALAEALVYSSKPSARARFPGNVVISRQYDDLVRVQETSAPEPVELQCPGEVSFGAHRLRCIPAEEVIQRENVFTLSATPPIRVRSRQPGDTITLSAGTKSLKKLFIDRKIPADQRTLLPVLEDEEGILGVYGIGADRKRQIKKLPGWQIIIDIQDKE